MMRALALACLAALAAPLAAASEGTAGADFLKIPVSTRASGMGGALSALSDDLSAVELNPARLGRLDGAVASAGHLAYFEGLAMENLELGYGWGRSGLGFSYVSLNSPDIQGLDSQDQPTGSFALHDMAATLGYGAGLGRLELGLNLRLVSLSLAGLNATGYGADLGAALDLGLGFSLALVAQNLGPSLSALESQGDPLPMTYRGGLGWKGEVFEQSSLLIEADLLQPSDSSLQLRGGAEIDYRSAFFVRAGGQYSEAFDSRQNFSAGAGFRYAAFQLDYSYVPFSTLGSAHRVSLSVYLSRLLNPSAQAPRRQKLSRPLNLKLIPSAGGMDISWEAPESGKAESYAVYVRAGADAELKRVNLKPLAHRLLHLKAAFGDKVYGFAVAALDPEGKEGERSRELKYRPGAAQLKLGPPEAPHGLKAIRKGAMIYLRWDAAQSPGRLSYQVYMSSRPGSAYAPVGGGETAQTELQWEPVGLKSRSAYLVLKSLRHDKDGTAESEFSEEVSVSVK